MKTTLTAAAVCLAAGTWSVAQPLHAATPAESTADESAAPAALRGSLAEIVVTATKRAESIQEVPMSLTAIDSDLIEKRGLVGMNDYLRALPNVNMVERGAGWNTIIIRGISTDLVSDSPVGIYFGETPVTGLGLAGNATSDSADLKLVDIERVEVLRGPQGTLYGAGSLAGTVRVVPAAPKLNQLKGGAAVSYSNTTGSGGDNKSYQGYINIPLIDNHLAVRAVGYKFRNSGYIDRVDVAHADTQVMTGVNKYGGHINTNHGVGSDEYVGYRVSILYSVNDALDFTLGHTHQVISQFGRADQNPPLGDYKQARLRIGPGGSIGEELRKNPIDITNLVGKYVLSWGTFSASSSLSKSKGILDRDTTESFKGQASYGLYHDHATDKATEVRFASTFSGPFQVIAGGYYDDFARDWDVHFGWSGDPALDPYVATPFGSIATHIFQAQRAKQSAVFGEATYKLTDGLTALFGGRGFHYNKDGSYTRGSGAMNGGDTFKPQDTQGSGKTLKASLKYEFNSDVMVYGSWSQGFRLGKPQGNVPAGTCDKNGDGVLDGLGIRAPESIEPDTLDNYEVGVKSSLLDRRMTLNASAYWINWNRIPLSITDPVCLFPVLFNAGKSVAKGVEMETNIALTQNLVLNATGSYGKSELTEDAPGLGKKGNELPNSPSWTYAIGLQYDFDLWKHKSFLRSDFSQIAHFHSSVAPTSPVAGGYKQLGVTGGVELGYGLNFEIYGHNLTNSNALTYWAPSLYEAYGLRPRTVGVTLRYDY